VGIVSPDHSTFFDRRTRGLGSSSWSPPIGVGIFVVKFDAFAVGLFVVLLPAMVQEGESGGTAGHRAGFALVMPLLELITDAGSHLVEHRRLAGRAGRPRSVSGYPCA